LKIRKEKKSRGGIAMKKIRRLLNQKKREELLERNKDIFFDIVSR